MHLEFIRNNHKDELVGRLTYLLIKLATQLKTSEYRPMMKPSRASRPETSRSGVFSVGDGDLNGVLGVFGVLNPPEGKPKMSLDSSSTDVPSRLAAR